MSRSKGLKNGLATAALSFAATILIFSSLVTVGKTERFVAQMPLGIESVGNLMQQVHNGIFNSWVPDACGINAIYISDETAERVKTEGLSFLNKPGEHQNVSRNGSHKFEPWIKMRKGEDFDFGESLIVSAFECAGKSGIPARKIWEGLKNGNGFKSGRSYTSYYIFPEQKLFVMVFFD